MICSICSYVFPDSFSWMTRSASGGVFGLGVQPSGYWTGGGSGGATGGRGG